MIRPNLLAGVDAAVNVLRDASPCFGLEVCQKVCQTGQTLHQQYHKLRMTQIIATLKINLQINEPKC